MTQQEEITRRRTFAVIAHPDAGKTTLTEKLLLFGGAIHVAGAVKSNKIKKGATSDFMEIERQRGISVATAVMGFEYRGCKINKHDTPGHQELAQDTNPPQAPASTSSIPPATRTSRRIPTVPLWPPTLLLWSSTAPRASRPRPAS